MQSKKILFSSHVSSRRGGAERSLFEIVKYIKTHTDYLPIVILPGRGELYTSLRSLGCRVYIVASNWWTVSEGEDSGAVRHHNMLTVQAIISIIEKERPFLCVTNTMVTPWLAYASALTDTRHAWFLREFGLLDQGLQFTLGIEQVYKTIDQLSDTIFVNSTTLQQHYAKLLPSHSKDIRVSFPYVESLPPPSSPSPFDPHAALKLVCIGQIKPSKGQFDAVKALKLLIEKGIKAQLFLVGTEEDEGYVREIKQYAKAHLPVDALVITGFRENPLEYVHHADIALVCSASEAFGRVVVESMLAKTPVVGKKAAGIKEIIQNESVGCLYTDIDELTKTVVDLHENRTLLQEMSVTAYKFCIKHFSIQNSIKDLLSYIKSSYNNPHHSNLDLSALVTAYQYLEVLHIQLMKQDSEFLQVKQELATIKSTRKWRLISALGDFLHKARKLARR